MVDNDLYSEYGLDTGGEEILRRNWPWLKNRIQGLLSIDSRITRWVKNKMKE